MEQAAKAGIDRAEALRRIHSYWLSRMVHDFRGPIFTARGYTKLLLDNRAGHVTVTQGEYLQNILDSIKKLSDLVEALQQFPSESTLHLEPVNVVDLLRSAVCEWRLREKTLQLIETIPPGSIVAVVDEAKLGEAVHILLGDAVEFSRSGGEVQIQVRREDDELTVKILASRPVSDSPAPPVDATIPNQILRLHGGSVQVDAARDGRFLAALRLPLVTFEIEDPAPRR